MGQTRHLRDGQRRRRRDIIENKLRDALFGRRQFNKAIGNAGNDIDWRGHTGINGLIWNDTLYHIQTLKAATKTTALSAWRSAFPALARVPSPDLFSPPALPVALARSALKIRGACRTARSTARRGRW